MAYLGRHLNRVASNPPVNNLVTVLHISLSQHSNFWLGSKFLQGTISSEPLGLCQNLRVARTFNSQNTVCEVMIAQGVTFAHSLPYPRVDVYYCFLRSIYHHNYCQRDS